MKSSETSANKKPEYVLFSCVRLSLRIQGWALKNARGLALSASRAVPGAEKCEKNEAERQPSGAPALRPLQVWNKILMLRLSVGIQGWALAARFHVFAILMCFIYGWQRVGSGTNSAYPQPEPPKKKFVRYLLVYPSGIRLKNIRGYF